VKPALVPELFTAELPTAGTGWEHPWLVGIPNPSSPDLNCDFVFIGEADAKQELKVV